MDHKDILSKYKREALNKISSRFTSEEKKPLHGHCISPKCLFGLKRSFIYKGVVTSPRCKDCGKELLLFEKERKYFSRHKLYGMKESKRGSRK